MRDAISAERCKKLHPKVRDEAILAIEDAEANFPPNIKVRVVQGLRTIAEQDALYNQKTKVTNAKGGQSFHNYGLSIDFAIMYDKNNDGTFEELSWDAKKDFDKNGVTEWNQVVNEFEKHGWEWGAKFRTFPDLPHVQKTFGYKWQQLFDKYIKKDFISGSEYVNI